MHHAPHVVVCDHEPHVNRILALKLDRAGYEVHVTTDAVTAAELIERTHPALVIAEDRLAEEDGGALLAQIHALSASCLLLTEDRPTDDEDFWSADAVFQKPFSPRELVAKATSLASPEPVLA